VATLHPVNGEVMPTGAVRAGAFVVRRVLAGTDYPEPGWVIVCAGHKHPRYRRLVSPASLGTAYRSAVAAGLDRIGMRELHS